MRFRRLCPHTDRRVPRAIAGQDSFAQAVAAAECEPERKEAIMRRDLLRTSAIALVIIGSGGFAAAETQPQSNAAFVNGALAVPGAPTNTDTVPAKFSQKNAADDELITLAYTFKTLSNEERRAIYEALRGKPAGTAFNADIGVELPVETELQPVPNGLANNVPQTKGY